MKLRSLMGLMAALAIFPLAAQQPESTSPAADWMGCAPEMGRLNGLEGTWKIQPEMYRPKKKEWTPGIPFYASFNRRFDACYLQSDLIMPLAEGSAFHSVLLWSYDKYRKVYRMVALENVVGLIDVFEGVFVGDTLVMDDERSGTSAPNMSGRLEFLRISFRMVNENEAQLSFQAKHNDQWVDGMRLRLTRQGLTLS